MIDDILYASDVIYAPDEEENIPIKERAREIAGRIRGDTLWQYKVIEGWWNEGVFVESSGRQRRGLTPIELVEMQISDLGEFDGLSLLTPNLEYVPYLVNRGAESVTLITKSECNRTRNVITSKVFGLEAEYLVNPELEATMPDKYDIAIGNPPYQGQAKLHQRFFNMAVNMVKEGGTVSFIQPATAYFNKKADTDAPSQKMRDNIKRYKCSARILNPTVFENVSIRGDLSVTNLVKKETSPQVDRIEYANGDVYKNIDLENITRTQMEPNMFARIKRKYETCVKKNGSLVDLITEDTSQLKARLAFRVTDPGWPIFFVKRTEATHGPFGLRASSKKEVDGIYEYLMTNPARFGLGILMFAANLAGGGNGISSHCRFQSYVDRRRNLRFS